jgi:hypothetical protein
MGRLGKSVNVASDSAETSCNVCQLGPQRTIMITDGLHLVRP